jgi:hypothetical protein
MSSNVKIDVAERGLPQRHQLKAGDTFVYTDEPITQLRLVPDPAFSRTDVSNKDILVGGPHSGMLDDSHPRTNVIVVDITATRSATQPLGAEA